MTGRARMPVCDGCGGAPIDIHDGDAALCDRCFSLRMSAEMGLPWLPNPPGPSSYPGPDGTMHRFRFRLWRSLSGIAAEAIEQGVPAGDGYRVKVFGSHAADPERLFTRLTVKLLARLARADLSTGPSGWPMISGDALTGRLEWNEDDGPYDVIVDGRRLTWQEFGEALEPFQGWDFELRFVDSEVVEDGRDPGRTH